MGILVAPNAARADGKIVSGMVAQTAKVDPRRTTPQRRAGPMLARSSRSLLAFTRRDAVRLTVARCC